MSTMNSEIYAAFIEAGSSEEKAKAAAISVTDYERKNRKDTHKLESRFQLWYCEIEL